MSKVACLLVVQVNAFSKLERKSVLTRSNTSSHLSISFSPPHYSRIFKKSEFYLLKWKPFENDLLFNLKSSYSSQDIWMLALAFCLCRKKNSLIKKIRLFSKIMTSQSTITIYILSNILRSKGKQTMKFGQVIEHNKRKEFIQKSCRK